MPMALALSQYTQSASEDKDTGISIMAEQTFENLEGRSMFTQFKPRRFKDAASLLTQCGFDSWGTTSKLTEETRKYLRGGSTKDPQVYGRPTQSDKRNIQSLRTGQRPGFVEN